MSCMRMLCGCLGVERLVLDYSMAVVHAVLISNRNEKYLNVTATAFYSQQTYSEMGDGDGIAIGSVCVYWCFV